MKFLLLIFLIQMSSFIVNACTTGELRLVDGTTANEGRVELCINGVWGTVCDDHWTNDNAEVVCRQLGYSTTGATYFSGSDHSYGNGTGSIFLDQVQCSGNECILLNCSHNPIGVHNCFHSEDVGVSCSSSLDTCTPFNSILSPTAPTIIMSSTNLFCEPPSSSPCNCPSFPSSSYQSSRECPTTTPFASLVFTITTTLILSVTATTTEAGTTASVTCQGAVAAAVVVPILILVLVAVVFIILLVLYRYHQKTGISKVLNDFPIFKEPVNDDKKASTLKEDNRVIYNISDNEAYNAIDTSRQDLSGSASVPLSSILENQQAPIYTEVRDTPEMEAKRGEEVLYEHPSVMTD